MKSEQRRILLQLPRAISFQSRRNSIQPAKLQAIGHAEVPKVSGDYEPGQSFLHRVFGYRGLVLFPYTIDVQTTKSNSGPSFLESNNFVEISKGGAAKISSKLGAPNQTYYQVLMHENDLPLIRTYMNEEMIVMSGTQAQYEPVSIRGLDHVAHDEIIPYKLLNSQVESMKHKAFEYFFTESQVSTTKVEFIPTEHCKRWEEKHKLIVSNSAVHKFEDEGVRITVMPFYAGFMTSLSESSSSNKTYYWNYVLRVELINTLMPITIRGARITLYSRNGKALTKDCRLIEGQEPRLTATQRAFQTVTVIDFSLPRGHTWGQLRVERDDGHYYELKLPSLILESTEKAAS